MTRAFGADDVARLRRKSKKTTIMMIADNKGTRSEAMKEKPNSGSADFWDAGDFLAQI
jgi:hypothetical protein